MSDTSERARASTSSSNPKSTAASDRAREPTPRRVYVSLRLEEISVDVAAKAEERESLTSALKGSATKDGPALKQLRQRRTYVAERLDILRKEQADLNAERKAMRQLGG